MVDDVLDGGRAVDTCIQLITNVEKRQCGECLCAIEIIDIVERAVFRIMSLEIVVGHPVAFGVDEDISAIGCCVICEKRRNESR
ncbi:hypothetical protein C456_06897 [Haloferax volcanii DSM 14919]|uniref:Uncharacterized protein n=1 Tax=Haloferax lucentense (strain DSM 14919 / JCM 9276 / NCIMB 13854 / Aa 2.2) TaxID=1230452 RepID=M0GT00_HALL2|nr:hypothetical protein C456_06897 [Haloferax lucentense DSM 14919]